MDGEKKLRRPSVQIMGRRDPETCGVWSNTTICPVTMNLPTRMLESAFKRICLRLRRPDRPVCIKCNGKKMPDGLEFIDLENKEKKETDMGQESTPGICDLCGEAKNLKTTRGKKCCPTCEFIWRAANNTPARVVDAVRIAQGEDYIRQFAPKTIEKKCDCGSVREDLINAQRRLHAAEQVIENVRIILGVEDKDESVLDGASRHQRRLQKAVAIWEETCVALDVDQSKIDDLPAVADKIMKELKMMRDFYNDFPQRTSSDSSREGVLLDLALDALSGKISGIDAERIAALR